MTTRLVIGPPGTGKTTYCLNQVDKYLQKGYLPHHIAFLSFTKQATVEAMDRAITRFGFQQNQFVWFRTLHSLAWRLNDLQWNQAFKDSDWRKFGAIMGIKFSSMLSRKRPDAMLEADDCMTEGDHLARIEQFSRVIGITLEEAYNRYCETDMPFIRLQQYATAYDQYKKHRGIYDYIDTINMCNRPLDVKVAIFDEAQDMTPQQFRMANRITKNVKDILYAGDDMQAIFAWNGADVEQFSKISNEITVLPKSYRLPKPIWDLAYALEHRVERSYIREWLHNDTKKGTVNRINTLSALDLTKGDWLLIGRNWRTLDETYVRYLRVMGYPYFYGKESSLDVPHIQAVIEYETLRKGIEISHDAATRIFKFISKYEMPKLRKDTYSVTDLGLAGLGPWMEALDLITEYDRE